MKNNYPKDDKLFEELASIQHNIWSDWQKYLHSKLVLMENGHYMLPAVDYKHWERQIKTDYKDLSEKEKDCDREQIFRYWKLIN